jgi:PIN domain nuclease of toxin-antitoxin system
VKLLLDTNALIWWLEGSRRLSRPAVEAIDDIANDVHVSAASAWEISTKARLGKLRFTGSLTARLEKYDVQPLAVTVEHGWAAGTLPPLHRDPFDRILIAQAQLEELIVVTADPMFARYGVPVFATA